MTATIPTYLRVLIASTIALALFFGGLTGSSSVPLVGSDVASAHSGHFCGYRAGDTHVTGYRTREVVKGYYSSWFRNWALIENQRFDPRTGRYTISEGTFNRYGCRYLSR